MHNRGYAKNANPRQKFGGGYSSAELETYADSYIKNNSHYDNNEYPDIIIVLNESFYDIKEAVEVKTDKPIMPFIDNEDSLIRGRVVVPSAGGGTNLSEYELLTSNSLQLMPDITPFQFLNFEDSRSIVSHMETLGYTTWVGHPADKGNYARGKIYPLLGFDKILFKYDFVDNVKYRSGYLSDVSAYETLLREYEQMGNSPRFMYLLTIQNHGGYDIVDDSKDTVHLTTEMGEHQSLINEYISSVNESDKAFKMLTQYLESSERKTVVLMLGDHCPVFVKELVNENVAENSLKLRSTPYIMWSNFPLDDSELQGNDIGMVSMAPMLLSACQLPLSPFYGYILELTRNVPVVSPGIYCTSKGDYHNYNEKTLYNESILNYFSMVHNNASNDENRVDKLFAPAIVK